MSIKKQEQKSKIINLSEIDFFALIPGVCGICRGR